MRDLPGHPLVPAGREDKIRISLLGGGGQPLDGELVAIVAEDEDEDATPVALVLATPGHKARTVVPWHAISFMRRDNPGDVAEEPF